MDTFVENSGVAEQEKQIQVAENERNIQVPIENAETAGAPLDNPNTAEWNGEGKEPAQDINSVRTKEKPDPLGRKAVNSPLNKMKAGYDYAFGKFRTKA